MLIIAGQWWEDGGCEDALYSWLNFVNLKLLKTMKSICLKKLD